MKDEQIQNIKKAFERIIKPNEPGTVPDELVSDILEKFYFCLVFLPHFEAVLCFRVILIRIKKYLLLSLPAPPTLSTFLNLS